MADAAGAPLWLTEADVRGLLSLEAAIDVLSDSYGALGAGEAHVMPRTHTRYADTLLHAVGGVLVAEGIAGTKTWIYTPGGAAPLLVLFSLEDGRLLAAIEAFALGQMRTAATSGLATRALSNREADTLALIGTGRQAKAQAAAVCAVRPIRHVRLFGRHAGRRAALASQLNDEHGVTVSEHDTVADAMHGAHVVTAITRAAEPVIGASELAPGMHVNGVGAITAHRREIDHHAVAQFDAIAVDALPQARADAGELRAAAESGLLNWADVVPLAEIVAGDRPGRGSSDDITFFKALGVGLSDVALGHEVMRSARLRGVGRDLEATTPLEHHAPLGEKGSARV
jgi:alanine dehydrogenase